jgi:hypothetical protein
MLVEKTLISDGDCVVSKKAFEKTIKQNEKYFKLGAPEELAELKAENQRLKKAVAVSQNIIDRMQKDCDACNFHTAITDLTRKLADMTAERDAAVEDIPHECGYCAHQIADEVCAIGSKDNCRWTYRGRNKGNG